MPRKGQRQVRICTRCDKPAKEKITNGKFKGYLHCCDEHSGWHHKPGPQHPNAKKGGRIVDDQGYVRVLDPRRERAKTAGSNYIAEHRLVVELKLGRRLGKDEVVHHMNGIRDDNRFVNLAVIGPEQRHESRTLTRALQARVRELERLLEVAWKALVAS